MMTFAQVEQLKFTENLKRQAQDMKMEPDFMDISNNEYSSQFARYPSSVNIPSNYHPLSSDFVLHPPSSMSPNDYLAFSHENSKKRRRQATVAQRRAANIRERKRMLSLNDAFEELRQIVPTFAHEKKISRIDTLRLAIVYISFMADILAGKDENDIEIKSLKHGWTSVREKLQQQMAAQQAAAQQAVLSQIPADYSFPAVSSVPVAYPITSLGAYQCPPQTQEYAHYPMESLSNMRNY